MGVTRWFRIPRCYVWEATKWINERERKERGWKKGSGEGRTKRNAKMERKGEYARGQESIGGECGAWG